MTAPVHTSAPEQLPTLRRLLARAPSPDISADRCGLCSAAVPNPHRHLLDEQDGTVLCACQACTLLFERDAAGRGHYRLIPNRRVRLAELSATRLNAPVGLAFFVARPDGSVVAHYPNPLGTTTCDVDPVRWQTLVRERPEIGELSPDVEAVLINTSRGAHEHWIVPIDDCYRLVAVIRAHWRGMSGGTEVWPAIERFFGDLQESRRPVRAATPRRGDDSV